MSLVDLRVDIQVACFDCGKVLETECYPKNGAIFARPCPKCMAKEYKRAKGESLTNCIINRERGVCS